MAAKKKVWKRNKLTTSLVHSIRKVLNDAGYDEEMAVTPLMNEISVLARKGEDNFNVRLDKDTLEIIEAHRLAYNIKRNNIRRVFREKE